jgi:hypothetical protein
MGSDARRRDSGDAKAIVEERHGERRAQTALYRRNPKGDQGGVPLPCGIAHCRSLELDGHRINSSSSLSQIP